MAEEDGSFARKVAKSFLVSGVGNAGTKIINVVALFFVLKMIEPSELGLASIVLAIFNIIQSVTQLGLGVAIVQAEDISRRQLDSLFWIALGLSTAIYLVIFAGAPLASWFYDEPLLTPMLRFQALAVVLFAAYLVSRNLMIRDMWFGRLAVADNVSLMVASGTMLLLAWLGHGAWAIVAGEFVQRAGQLVFCQAFRPYVPRWRVRWGEVRSMVRFGVYATGSRLLYNFYINADYLIVGRFFGADAVGVYSLAYRMVKDPVRTLVSIVNQVAYPAFARLQLEEERLRRYFYAIARVNMSSIGTVLLVIAVFTEDALMAIGYEQWLAVVPLVQILTVYGLILSVSPLVPQLLNAVGRARQNFLYSLTTAVVMPVAFLVAASMSLEAVAWVWGTIYPVVVVVLFLFGSRALKQSFWTFAGKTLSGAVVLAPVAVVALGVRWLLAEQAAWNPAPVAVLGAAVTLVSGLGLAYARERDTVAAVLKRHKRKDGDD
ncbi:MAG: lipopolysaccharide biosynthesis protein [Myxococcota bacterium]